MSQEKKLKKDSKQAVIKAYAPNKSDTGSVEVQAAVISAKIDNLSAHLKSHTKDFSSRRGLLMLVSKRRTLLDYLKAKSSERYEALIKKLDIRK